MNLYYFLDFLKKFKFFYFQININEYILIFLFKKNQIFTIFNF